MIDITKCELEECYDNNILGETVYYFMYPKELGVKECNFNIEEYGKFVFCSLAVNYSDTPNNIYVTIAATVSKDDGGGLSDVDWHDMIPDINYSSKEIMKLLNSFNI